MMFRSSEAMLRNHCQPTADQLYSHCTPIPDPLRLCFYPFCTHCAPISKAQGLFAILQTRTERERRTQKERLPILPLNTLTGGSIYGKSVSKKDGLLDLPQNGYGANGTRKRRLFAHRRKRHLNNIKIEEVTKSKKSSRRKPRGSAKCSARRSSIARISSNSRDLGATMSVCLCAAAGFLS